jgi:hypothetical protein
LKKVSESVCATVMSSVRRRSQWRSGRDAGVDRLLELHERTDEARGVRVEVEEDERVPQKRVERQQRTLVPEVLRARPDEPARESIGRVRFTRRVSDAPLVNVRRPRPFKAGLNSCAADAAWARVAAGRH